MGDPNSLAGWLVAAAGAVVTTGFGIREYLKNEKVSNASDASTIKGLQGNDVVLSNLVKEVSRLSSRVTELEDKVEHLTDKLANVRLVAVDCYTLANECCCNETNRERLLEHLRSIIRDA